MEQYFKPYPVCRWAHPAIRAVLDVMRAAQAFPAQRFADVTLVLRDGRILRSDTTSAQGSPEDPMSREQIATKYRELTAPVVGAVRSAHIESAIQGLRTNEPIHVLYDSIFAET